MLNVLMNILNEMDAFVYVSDLETDELLFLNRKIKDVFAIGDDFRGRPCWSAIQKGFTGRCPFCHLSELVKNPNAPVVWEECNTITGRYYKNVDSIIDWEDGRKVHLQYAIDITETKLAQHDAANMLKILKNILNGMDAHVYVSDMATDEILFINKTAKEAFGLDDQAVGQICWKVLQDGCAERCSFCPNFKLEIDPNTPVVWEEHNSVTKRRYRNVDSVIEWMDGKKVHVQHSSDITDILDAQGETRAIRERLETALASSQAGVWELDLRAGMLTYDTICANLFGLDAQKDSMPISSLIVHLEKMAQQGPGEDAFKGLREGDPYADSPSKDFCLKFPDGGLRYVRNHGNTIRDREGKALRVVGMCIDITSHVTMENDLKAARDAAENASRAKSQFLSNMSHEIRTPMNAIIGMTEILLHEDLNDRQRHYLDDIRTSATSLLDIINEILDFSKIEAGKLELNQVHYSLTELMHNLESIFAVAAKKKGITFRMDIRGELPACLYGDDLRLRQVLVNVIGNAIKFTEKGKVSLTAEADGNRLRFAINDTGIGIKSEDLPNIFTAFDRVDLGNTRTIAGTGLGLSITKNLVSMMDGTIRVASEYGIGTTFYFEFPLVVGDPAELLYEEASYCLLNAPDARILVVDDNEVNLNVAAGLLRLFNISCDTALSGREAIRKIDAEHYDIVFMDHMMPEMDGIETTKLLRERYDAGALTIVALTANAVAGARENLLSVQMNDYLSKPIVKEQLSQVLSKWLPADKICRVEHKKPSSAEPERALSAVLARVAAIDGVNVHLALDRINGLQDVYETSLGILVRRLPDAQQRLSTFLENEDARGFAIEVHGLKGSLHNIGATSMALEAELLENRAKESDLHFCRERLPALQEAFSTLHEALIAALGEEESAPARTSPGDSGLLMQQLSVLRNLVDTFEDDEALSILRRLREYDYGEALNGALDNVSQLVEAFEHDRALALLDGLPACGAG